MKTTEIVLCLSCVIVALSLTFIQASPTWRPQGRFGKRAPIQHIPRGVLETGAGLIPTVVEIPVELISSSSSINQYKTKPLLCSSTGIEGYPLCEGKTLQQQQTTSSRIKDLKTLADFLNL